MAVVKKRIWTNSTGDTRSAWKVDWTDQHGKRARRQFNTKREADAFRVEIEGQLKSGTFRADADKVTVAETAASYLEVMMGRHDRGEQVTGQYLYLLKGVVANYVDPTDKSRTPFRDGVGPIKLSQLSARTVADFRDRIRAAGTTPYHTKRVLGVLSRILDHAIGQDLLAVNVARGVKVIGRRDETSARVTPPAKAALQAILKKADEDFALKIRFAAATGLRASEQWALRWQHVDFDGAMVRVETRVDRYGEEDTTKTTAGVREVPMGDGLIAALRELKLRSKWSSDTDLVFPNARGRYTSHINILHRKFTPLFDEVKVEKFTWHGLRHFAVSCWIEAGLTPKTVQTFAGHSSLQVTTDRYGHLFPSDDHKKAMDRISKSIFT